MDHSVILWDKEYTDNPAITRHVKQKFSHDIPPKTPPKPRWNYVEDPPVVRSTHYTLIEEHKKQPKHDPSPRFEPQNNQSITAATTTENMPPLNLHSRPLSAPILSISPKSAHVEYPASRRSQPQSPGQLLTSPKPRPLSSQYSSSIKYIPYSDTEQVVNDVTSSYHPPKVIPPFHTGVLPLSDTTTINKLKIRNLSRTGGGYINSQTGIAAGGNKFVELHTIKHESILDKEIKFDKKTQSHGIGTGKILNQPGISRNDARLHKCIDDLIIHLCDCKSNVERQSVKMEFTNTIRKYGKASKVVKDKYGRIIEKGGIHSK